MENNQTDLEKILDAWRDGVQDMRTTTSIPCDEPGGFNLIVATTEPKPFFKWAKYLPKFLQFRWMYHITEAKQYTGCYPITCSDQIDVRDISSEEFEFRTGPAYTSPIIDAKADQLHHQLDSNFIRQCELHGWPIPHTYKKWLEEHPGEKD